nr:ABC transporter ATP-binding protein [Desulfobacula sp.]
MPTPLIDIKDLSFVFDDGHIGLNRISLTISRGEFILLAGKNGSGKTTFLRHLNGLLLPTSGRVRVNGKEVSKHLTETRKTVGMVFQDPDTQMVGDTVFDEVAFGPENLKQPRARITENVTRILETLNLDHLKERHPATLSGGEKRKTAIAGILAMDPEVIVFDEPFSNLDYPGILQVLEVIMDLHRSGQTLIIATHDIEPVIFEAGRMIIMENGRVMEDGAPLALAPCLESYGVREPCFSRFGLEPQPWLR